jgi:hypothetical protein
MGNGTKAWLMRRDTGNNSRLLWIYIRPPSNQAQEIFQVEWLDLHEGPPSVQQVSNACVDS